MWGRTWNSAAPRAAICLSWAIGVTSPAPCRAQTTTAKERAQTLFDEARALITTGRAEEACLKFEESNRLDRASGTLVNLARCYEQTGRLASAWRTYLEGAAAAQAAGNLDRERGALEAARALEPRVPRLRVNVVSVPAGAPLRLSRDGAPIPDTQWGIAVPENSGQRTIVAEADGYETWSVTLTLSGEGGVTEVTVPPLEKVAPVAELPSRVAAPAPPQPERAVRHPLGTQRIAALAIGGVGVAGVIVGGVFSVVALSKKADAQRDCDGPSCRQPDGVDAGNEARSASDVATVGAIVGGVGLAAGLTLWFTAPRERTPSRGVSFGPNCVRFEGTF